MKTKYGLPSFAGLLALVLTVSACSGGGGGTDDGGSSAPAASEGPLNLAGACPETVVIQTDWNPESEYATYYQLVGDGYEIDTEAKSVTGPLVASGKDTGVDVEIRVGGPAIGFQTVPAQMYADDSITLGQVNTDETVQFSAEQPMLAVMAPLEISPFMISWDPESHPEFNTIADIGQTDTKVLYYEGETYMDYLIGAGILRESQVDGSFDGSPAKFVASGGDIAVQNFATDSPFSWQHKVDAWGKPLDFELIHDTGYPFYSHSIAIRAGDKDELAPCLEKLVPIMQQAQVDFMADPQKANELIVELVSEYRTGWQYDMDQAQYATEKMTELGIVGNGKDDTVGNFDMDRVATLVDIVKPIFAGQNVATAEGLTPEDIVTNEYIDDSIGLPAGGQ